jgi:hypothetical protein
MVRYCVCRALAIGWVCRNVSIAELRGGKAVQQ